MAIRWALASDMPRDDVDEMHAVARRANQAACAPVPPPTSSTTAGGDGC